ncbi:MAG: NAD(P)/FAD-dependent oxidoreductase [Nitrospirota bacterium]|nr:NAD(P)/FAD-dependent oxidoreductase [Nitrospirota bacterium]
MDADVTIIGAGVIGLAVAAELSERRLSVYVIEKNASHGRGISSRNSEVVHAGIYYPAGSLKAGLCVEGRELLYELCLQHKIPHKKTGKLIIATTENEMDQIGQLMNRAMQNGVSSVCLVDQKQIQEMEPNIRAIGGLYSPDTGIISAHALMDYYLQKAKMNGAEIVCGTEVVSIETEDKGYRIGTLNGQGEGFEFTSERVINASGLHSDIIARMTGKDYTLHYCKGDYFSIANAKNGIVQRLVYPVPEKNHVGLGVHLTLDLSGRMKLGPDATYIDRVEDYKVDADKKDRFYESAVKFLPFIRREDIVPDMSGIRPKLQGPGEAFRDFVISEDMPGFINLVGIESPGLTAAPAIARYVKKMFDGMQSGA